MVSRRLLKQFSYAGGCATFLALILVGVVFTVRSPRFSPAVIPSPSVSYVPVMIEELFSVQHIDAIDVAVRLRNRNPHVGVADYPVIFIIEDTQGREITRRQEAAYLLPGSLRYVATLGVPVREAVRVRVEVPLDPPWQELPPTIRLPQLGAFLRGETHVQVVGSTQVQQQKGIANNASSYGLARVDIVALAYDSDRKVIGIGKTFLGELGVGEQREFTVQWPQPPRVPADIITALSTNAFDEDNVLPVVGDPGSIR